MRLMTWRALSISPYNEGELGAVQKEGVALKELMFKTSQELFRLRTKERDLIAEIAGGQSQNKNMGHKILQLDAQVGLLTLHVKLQLLPFCKTTHNVPELATAFMM